MIKLQLLDKNILSLQPLLTKKLGLFEKYNVNVDIELISFFPAFDMSKVTANVGDVTRILERVHSGEDLCITGTLTKTMKLILKEDYKDKSNLKIICSPNQSLGIYAEQFLKDNSINYEFIINNKIVDRVEMLKLGEVDGACMIGPFLEQFIGNGYETVLDGKNESENYTCWAFKREYVEENYEEVINFHKAQNEAAEYFNKLSKVEKLKISHKILTFDENLDEYYSNFEFENITQYKESTLKNAFNWKIKKDKELIDLDIRNLILGW